MACTFELYGEQKNSYENTEFYYCDALGGMPDRNPAYGIRVLAVRKKEESSDRNVPKRLHGP